MPIKDPVTKLRQEKDRKAKDRLRGLKEERRHRKEEREKQEGEVRMSVVECFRKHAQKNETSV